MRRLALVLALILPLAALAAGCGDDDDGGGGEGPVRVVVSDTAGVPSAFIEYGVREGFFEKRDLTVEVQPSQGGATVVPAVVSGDVDIGGSNLVSVLLAQGKDIPIKIVAPGTFVDGDKDFAAIVVAGDSEIRTPKDLEGRTLAVNTQRARGPAAGCVQALLRRHGGLRRAARAALRVRLLRRGSHAVRQRHAVRPGSGAVHPRHDRGRRGT